MNAVKRLQSRDRRSVRVNGRLTSINVELPIWDRFREIALTLGCTYDSLLAHIDRTMRLEPPRPGHHRGRSLSSAVRMFVTLNYPPQANRRTGRSGS